MNILLLDDEPAIRERIKKVLQENKYDVEDFSRIDIAKDYFNKNSKNIDCIIVDLNMDDEWLDEFTPESHGGMLSGWVFVNRFVFRKRKDIPTIIYSGIAPFIKEYVDVSKFNNVILIDKMDLYSDNGVLLRAIQKLLDKEF